MRALIRRLESWAGMLSCRGIFHAMRRSESPALMTISPASSRRRTVSTICCCIASTSLTRTGPRYSISSLQHVRRALRQIAQNLRLEFLRRSLESQRPLVVVDLLEQRLNRLVVELHQVVEHEHQPADLVDQIGVFPVPGFPESPLFVMRSVTLRICATVETPPAFSSCWLKVDVMRPSRLLSTSA